MKLNTAKDERALWFYLVSLVFSFSWQYDKYNSFRCLDCFTCHNTVSSLRSEERKKEKKGETIVEWKECFSTRTLYSVYIEWNLFCPLKHWISQYLHYIFVFYSYFCFLLKLSKLNSCIVLIYAYSEFKISCIELDIKGIHLIRVANYKRDWSSIFRLFFLY